MTYRSPIDTGALISALNRRSIERIALALRSGGAAEREVQIHALAFKRIVGTPCRDDIIARIRAKADVLADWIPEEVTL